MNKLKVKSEKLKVEHSAGGIIYRTQGKNIQILLIQDKNNKWTFPKGLIEQNEDPIDTAKREIFEEVGLTNLDYIEILGTTRYFYRFQDNLIRKRVEYFLFRYSGNEVPKALMKEGIGDTKWFDPETAVKVVGYAKTNKPILEKAIKMIA